MVELIKHDYKILFSYKKIVLLIAVVIPILMNFFEFLSILGISQFIIALIIISTNYNSSKLLNSLPNKKREIVISKYIFMIINALAFTIYLLFLFLILERDIDEAYILDFNNVLALFIFNISFLFIICPLSFMFSENGTAFSILLTILIVDYLNEFIMDKMVEYLLIFIVISIILLICSFLMSLSVFNEREFS